MRRGKPCVKSEPLKVIAARGSQLAAARGPKQQRHDERKERRRAKTHCNTCPPHWSSRTVLLWDDWRVCGDGGASAASCRPCRRHAARSGVTATKHGARLGPNTVCVRRCVAEPLVSNGGHAGRARRPSRARQCAERREENAQPVPWDDRQQCRGFHTPVRTEEGGITGQGGPGIAGRGGQ